MPCVIGIESTTISFPVTNTHVDLHGYLTNDAHGMASSREKNAVDKLHGEIEHATLDGYGNCSPTRSCREVRAEHVASSAWGEVPDTRNNEGSHNCVPT